MSLIGLIVDATSLIAATTKFKDLKTRLPQALSEGLNEGGDKVRTQVRKQMVVQSGIKYSAVKTRTYSVKSVPGSLHYEITSPSRPVKIIDVSGLRITKAGVVSNSWGQRHLFKRSFGRGGGGKGKYLARLASPPGTRGRVRQILGPNTGKELVKPEMLVVFHASVARELPPIILKRMARALGVT